MRPHSAAPVATVWISRKVFCLPSHSPSPGGCAWLTSSEVSGIQTTIQAAVQVFHSAKFTAQTELVEIFLQAVETLFNMTKSMRITGRFS